MKFNFNIGNITADNNFKAENLVVGIECQSKEIKEVYDTIKTALKELPETINSIKNGAELINNLTSNNNAINNTNIIEGDEQ